jgi:hypothetical protein
LYRLQFATSRASCGWCGPAGRTVAVGDGAAPTTAICFPRQLARYVRITPIGTGSMVWSSIYEMTVMP